MNAECSFVLRSSTSRARRCNIVHDADVLSRCIGCMLSAKVIYIWGYFVTVPVYRAVLTDSTVPVHLMNDRKLGLRSLKPLFPNVPEPSVGRSMQYGLNDLISPPPFCGSC